MAGGVVRWVGMCMVAFLATLPWTTSARAQTDSRESSRPAASDSTALPDAPSAVIPPTRQPVQMARAQSAQLQSWWLVTPENAPFRPLTKREKFMSFVHHTISPYTLAGAMYDATWAQAWNDPKEYGAGMTGWGERLGAAAAGTETRSFFGSFLFPTLLRQDPRYFAMYHGPVKNRVLHAVERVFVTRNDEGQDTFNTSGMLTIAFTESLGMAWAPEGQRSAGKLGTRMLGAMQGDATTFMLREFTPDLLRIFKHHAPKSIKRIEEKIPAQITGDTGQP